MISRSIEHHQTADSDSSHHWIKYCHFYSIHIFFAWSLFEVILYLVIREITTAFCVIITLHCAQYLDILLRNVNHFQTVCENIAIF